MSVRVPTSRSANKLQFSLFCGSPETSFSCADSTTTPKQAELFLLLCTLIANQNTIIIIKVKLKSTSVIVVFGRLRRDFVKIIFTLCCLYVLLLSKRAA